MGIRAADGGKLSAVADDFKFIPQQPDTSTYREGIGEIRAKVTLNPLGEPWYEIETLPGYRLITIQSGRSSGPRRVKKRFLSGQIAKIQADMGKFWAIQISEKDLQSSQATSSIDGLLIAYMRNNLGSISQHLDRVAEVVASPGAWSRVSELKQVSLANIPQKKEKKAGSEKISKNKDGASGPSVSVPSVSTTPRPPGSPPAMPPLPPGAEE